MSSVSPRPNKPAAGVPWYTPAQEPPAGSVSKRHNVKLYQNLKIRGLDLPNRIIVAPMGMYSGDEGHATDYHLVHLGQYAHYGAGLTIVESTATAANGRYSPEDTGLYKDSHIAAFRRVTDFFHSQNQKIGIQIAHAGRKSSLLAPWAETTSKIGLASAEDGGWPGEVVSASAIAYAEGWPLPKELTVGDIQDIIQGFAKAAERAVAAGFDTIELHGAHGFLINNFLSPLSNQRTDQYGGSFENRIRFAVETIKAVRRVIPETMPLFFRISATEWMEYTGKPSWDVVETIKLAKLLPELGVDFLDVSTGGNHEDQRIDIHPLYQIDIACQIRKALRNEGNNLLIGAVGSISTAEMARDIVDGGYSNNDGKAREKETQADAVLMGRQFLREPNLVLNWAKLLNAEVKWPAQYHRAPLRQ